MSEKVGCGLMLAGGSREATLAQARLAESFGFDSLWVGDHVAFHVPMLDSLSLLAFLAAATSRVTLGTCVYLLPLRHPTHVAKQTATVDVLSGGRMVLGVGVGGEYPPEFDASGVSVRERGARADEAIPLLRRLWSENDVRHEGTHFRFGPVSLDPKPVQAGGPAVWVGGRSPAAMRRAGRLGDGWVSTMTSPERFRENLARIAEHREAAGRNARPFVPAALLFTALGDAHEPALDRAAELLERLYRRPFREAAAKYCLLGRPADCLEQAACFVEAGARHIVLAPLGDPAGFAERAGRELVPGLRELGE
jgi:probable F420-dependent oxidoreductase